MTMKPDRKYKIPQTLPMFIEVERDGFADCETATAADWKKARQFTRERRIGGRSIHAVARTR